MHQTRGIFFPSQYGEVKTLNIVAEGLEGNIQPPENSILILYKCNYSMYKDSGIK